MTNTYITIANQPAVYRGHTARPDRLGGARPSTRPWIQARFIDVRLERREWEFLCAAVELFDGEGRVDPTERDDWNELVDLLQRHGELARWSREQR